MKKYILDENDNPVECEDIVKWREWFEKTDKTIEQTRIKGETFVSTVFMGIDHAFGLAQHAPILFETMIFGGEHDEYQRRYCTMEEAEAGHAKAVTLAKGE